MKNIIYKYYIFVSSLLSGIGMFCIASGIRHGGGGIGSFEKFATWYFDPTEIGIGAAFIVGAILLYKDARSKSK